MSDTAPLMRIGLKYKNLEAFVNAAYATFAKGRMSVKSRKDLQVGQRLILAITIPEQPAAIEIVCEVSQRISAKNDGDLHTFALRWVNYTEKKLARLIESVPGWRPAEVPPPSPEPPPIAPAAPVQPAPAQSPARPQPAPAPAPAGDDAEEYVIDCDDCPGGNYPSFMDRPNVIIPDAPDSSSN